jgi:hypothetical protein
MKGILQYLQQMLTGPGHLRVLVQPTLAILLGIVDGRKDSHAGQRPFGVVLRAKRGAERWTYLKQNLRRVLVPLCLAIILSMVFQYVVRRSIHLLPAFLFAILLVALPYVLARGIANRIDVRWHHRHPRRAST